VFVIILFNDASSVTQQDYTTPTEGVTSELRIEKDLEGSSHGLI
jgi:hypothetical protein